MSVCFHTATLQQNGRLSPLASSQKDVCVCVYACVCVCETILSPHLNRLEFCSFNALSPLCFCSRTSLSRLDRIYEATMAGVVSPCCRSLTTELFCRFFEDSDRTLLMSNRMAGSLVCGVNEWPRLVLLFPWIYAGPLENIFCTKNHVPQDQESSQSALASRRSGNMNRLLPDGVFEGSLHFLETVTENHREI